MNFVVLSSLIISAFLLVTFVLRRRRRKNTIAFFHLYYASGGGGERVLWHAIEAIFKKYPNYTIYIYSQRKSEDDTFQALVKVRELFKIDLLSNIDLIEKLEFVPLNFSFLIESKRYPFLTLLFQNLGSIVLALEAAWKLTPEIYMETIGFTFTLPIFKLANSKVITYVHYPTISSDMIHNVQTGKHASFNNRAIFVKSSLMRKLKLVYYKLLAYAYKVAGRRADLVMVNSSWTRDHISSLWGRKVHVVYPPCDVDSFQTIGNLKIKDSPLISDRNESTRSGLKIISIAQFRPEKNHQLQIEAFDLFLSKTKELDSELTLYGGCRDADDRKRVDELRELIQRLDLGASVRIVVGAPFDQLLEGMQAADVALHTMQNEHFGIVVVECMAAGLLTVAHKSGGPKRDIIEHGKNGYLATDVRSFSDMLLRLSSMKASEQRTMRLNAMTKSNQFSSGAFQERLLELMGQIV